MFSFYNFLLLIHKDCYDQNATGASVEYLTYCHCVHYEHGIFLNKLLLDTLELIMMQAATSIEKLLSSCCWNWWHKFIARLTNIITAAKSLVVIIITIIIINIIIIYIL